MKTITDEQRLNWLIDNGAYTAIDHDEYWGLTNEERRSEMRNRVDKFISKELNATDSGSRLRDSVDPVVEWGVE